VPERSVAGYRRSAQLCPGAVASATRAADIEMRVLELNFMRARTFTQEDPALPMHFPAFVFRTLCAEGCNAGALLEGTGLTAEHLDDPNSRFSFSSLRRLTVNAMKQTSDPHLGAKLGERFEATYIGLPAYAAMNAAHFQDALDVMSRFFFLTFPTIEFAVLISQTEQEAGVAAVRLRPKFPLGDIAYFLSSFALVACDGLFRTLLRTPQVTLRGEMMVGAPDGWADISPDIGFPIGFDAQDNLLLFPAALLCQPLPGADPINHTRLVKLCEKFAAVAGYETTPVNQVLSFLDAQPEFGATLSEAAAALGYSERGLRRQLERSGASYRKLVERVLERRARDMLANTALPISVIAQQLDYDTPSNFARSFKRWTGVSPKAFRNQRRTQRDPGQN
jgi:AraC-like DNA-binding protein